jgi:hypothetical protein
MVGICRAFVFVPFLATLTFLRKFYGDILFSVIKQELWDLVPLLDFTPFSACVFCIV